MGVAARGAGGHARGSIMPAGGRLRDPDVNGGVLKVYLEWDLSDKLQTWSHESKILIRVANHMLLTAKANDTSKAEVTPMRDHTYVTAQREFILGKHHPPYLMVMKYRIYNDASIIVDDITYLTT